MFLAQALAGNSLADQEWCYPFWIRCPEGEVSSNAVFRKVFKFDAKPKRCFMTVTPTDLKSYNQGGKYTIFVNGRKIAEDGRDDWGFWAYPRWFDATGQITAGENIIGVEIALNHNDGTVVFNFEADARFEDGRREMAVSDGSWKCVSAIPLDKKWVEKGFDDSKWKNAVEIGRKWGRPRAQAGGKNDFTNSMDNIKSVFDAQFQKIVDLQLKQSEINIVPRPHQFTLKSRRLCLSRGTKPEVTIALAGDKDGERFAAQLLVKALEQGGCKVPEIKTFNEPDNTQIILSCGEIKSEWLKARLRENEIDIGSLPDEGYAVFSYKKIMGGKGFILAGKDATGLLYAVYTFIQLMHQDGDELTARCGRIVDYPDIGRRGLIGSGYAWMGELAWISYYRFNRSFFITNMSDPIDQKFLELADFARHLGIECIFYIHPMPDFCFSNPVHLDLLLRQMEAADKHGFREISLQGDDFPLEANLVDSEVYGPGKTGLAKAHLDYITTASRKAKELNLHLYFCPMAYGAYSNSSPEVEYLRIIGDIPREVDVFSAPVNLEPLKHLPVSFQRWRLYNDERDKWLETFNHLLHRKLTRWHNDTGCGGYGGGYFGEYPVISKEQADLVQCVFTMTHAWGITRANALCWMNNWWNLNSTLPLKIALEKEWGPHAASYLYRYAETIGLQTGWGPGLSFYARQIEANQENLKYLREIAGHANQAGNMDWAGSGIDASVIAELKARARKMELLVGSYGDGMEKNLIQSEVIKGNPERLINLQKNIDHNKAELKSLGMTSYIVMRYSKLWEYIGKD